MQRKPKRAHYLNLLLVFGILFAATTDRAASQTSKRETRAKSNFLEGPAFTLENVVALVKSYRRGAMRLDRLLEGLQKRKVSFDLTEENLAILQQAQAPDQVINLVRELSPKPPAPPPPAPKPVFTLEISCEPAECAASLDGQTFSGTYNKKVTFPGLAPAQIGLIIKAEGFENDTKTLDLRDAQSGQIVRQEVHLVPTEATQLKWGDALFDAMMAKMHLPATNFQVTGALVIKNAGVDQWGLSAQLQGPGAARIDLSKPNGHVNAVCALGRCQVEKGSIFGLRKSPFTGSKEERALQENTLLFHVDAWLAGELSSYLARLASEKVSASSLVEPGLASQIQVNFKSGRCTVALDKGVPSSLKCDTGGNVALVKYSGYRQVKSSSYPATTEIQFSDNEKHSVLFQDSEFSGAAVSAAKPK